MKTGILHYVLALRECGYPAAAAAKCGVSSSTLISSLKRMESELGILLYDRDSRRLTLAGNLYADACLGILEEDARLRTAIADLQPKNLTVGHASYVDSRLISRLSMEIFAQSAKNPEPRIRAFLSDEPPESLLTGKLNLFIACHGASPSSRLTFLPLLSSPLFLVVPPGQKVNAARPMKSIGGLKLIALFQDTELHRQQFLLAKRAGADPETLIETNSLILAENLIRSGAGYTLANAGITHSLAQCDIYPIPNSKFTLGVWLLKEKSHDSRIMEIYHLLCHGVEELYGNSSYVTLLYQEGNSDHVS
ncbi:MAG: LysR family transcriptional regulator [Clostridiales bacterium]|nr:LysR family transcriptional regulator [Clostridiales bacterium]